MTISLRDPENGRPVYTEEAFVTRRAELAQLLVQQAAAEANKESHKKYDQELVVRVWREGQLLRGGRFGHVALTLRFPNESRYISWWPEGAGAKNAPRDKGRAKQAYRDDKGSEMTHETMVSLLRGQFQPRQGQVIRETGKKTYLDENNNWQPIELVEYIFEQRPTVKVCLPGIGATGVYFGLAPWLAARWFNDFVTNDGQYQAASRHHNCAGVVRTALKHAGGEAFHPAPKCHVFAAPSEIEEWALAISARVDDLNRRAAAFTNRWRPGGDGLKVLLPGDKTCPGPEEWSALTRRKDGTRGKNITAAGALLQKLGEGSRSCATKEGMVKFLQARIEIFELIERALDRDRDPFDADRLRALMLRILRAL